MKDRITIQTASATQDSVGEEDKIWTDLPPVWAEVIQQSGREYFASDHRTAEVHKVFSVRYRTDLTCQMRVVHDGNTYDIKDLNPLKDKGRLEIMAKAVVT